VVGVAKRTPDENLFSVGVTSRYPRAPNVDVRSGGEKNREVARIGAVTVVVMLALAAAGEGFGARPLPLTARVIAHGELAGFGPFGPAHVQTFTAPASFLAAYQQAATPSQVSEWIASLKREGFVAVAVEQLGSLAANRGGLSWAMELGSSADARSELLNEARSDQTHGPVSRFAVGGIPMVFAFRLGTSSSGGDNVLFSDGRYLYFVGIGWSTGGKPARAALLAAAQTLYKRVRGHPTT
jgi:hypothetical protein